ncbi:unnamed protein product [Didymodactylos carnosus]|uniref:Uncharacterized protein n=1 Tax=Didymodactylos carnosus TaxID=1234261 RepID=A0A8S2HQD0_9BILA|nr:unnamed protein product [Didymodactylos carnosus]CAF3675394.1 unnamed protein product [Didymodactylos carnosus]
MSLMLASNWSVIDNLGPGLLSCKSLVELTRMNELQSIAIEILKPAAATLNDELDKLVEHALKRLEPVQMTMASMSTAASNFQTVADAIRKNALKEFADKTKKSYFSTDLKAQWERTIIASLKGLTEQWNHIFDDRLQEGSHAKIIKEVEGTLIARAEARFNQDESSNVEQLRKAMKVEIEELRRASEKNQQALFEQSDTIIEKIVRLYMSCLHLHKHERGRQIYNILPAMPVTNFMQHSKHLVKVWPLLVDFFKNTAGTEGFRLRVLRSIGISTQLDAMWQTLQDQIHWFERSDAAKNREIFNRILREVLPKLQGDLRQLINLSHPIYNKIHVMEQAIDKIEGAVSMRAVTDHVKYLNPIILVADLAVITLRLLIDESIAVEKEHYTLKSSELNKRIASLEQSVERQLSTMADSSKQGTELANTVAAALFSEVRRIVSIKITRDIRQAVTASDHIVHDNVQQLAYTSSFTMANAENILKYVTDINRYFLEVSLGSIRTIFNAVIHDQTAQLESLLNTLLSDINDEVQRNECKNYAEVNRMIEERANTSFMHNTKGHTNVAFSFPAALPMSIGNSSLFKSTFRCILGFSSNISAQASLSIDSLRHEAFDQCVRAIQQKLGCNERCPGCGAKCAVTTDHDEQVVPRTLHSEFPIPTDANSPVKIHKTQHHLAHCLNGTKYHGTAQPVLHKCYQQWTSSGIHINDIEIMRPTSLYYNHRQPSWFQNLDEMACTAIDREAEYPETEQRRAWMLVRCYICRWHQLNDYSDAEYANLPETYPLVESLPADFDIKWNDTSL